MEFAVKHRKLLLLIVVSLLVLLFCFGLCSYTVDSEIWALSFAKSIFRFSDQDAAVYNKPLCYVLLYLPYLLPLNSVQHILLVKGIFVVNGLILNLWCYRLFCCIAKSQKVALVAMILLLTNNTWFAECFRIRSDLLALSFCLYALLEVLQCKGWSWKSILCLVLAFFATPKMVVWLLPLVLFAQISFVGSWKRIVGILLLFAGLQLGLVWQLPAYQLAVEHFRQSVLQANGSWTFLHSWDWFFVRDSLYHNPLHWLLIASGFVGLVIRKSEFRGLLVMQILLLGLFTVMSPKTYYFWAAEIPFLMLPLVDLLSGIVVRPSLVRVLTLAVIANFAVVFFNQVRHQIGIPANQFIADLESWQADAPGDIYDGVGLVVRGRELLAYVGEGDSMAGEWAFARIQKNHPSLIVLTDRVKMFVPQLQNGFLRQYYHEVQADIWVQNEISNQRQVSEVLNGPRLFNQRLLR